VFRVLWYRRAHYHYIPRYYAYILYTLVPILYSTGLTLKTDSRSSRRGGCGRRVKPRCRVQSNRRGLRGATRYTSRTTTNRYTDDAQPALCPRRRRITNHITCIGKPDRIASRGEVPEKIISRDGNIPDARVGEHRAKNGVHHEVSEGKLFKTVRRSAFAFNLHVGMAIIVHSRIVVVSI